MSVRRLPVRPLSFLSPEEAGFVFYTLLASRAFRGFGVARAEAFDKKAHAIARESEIGCASVEAYDFYHFCYCLWRDNGFKAPMLRFILFQLRSRMVFV